jgi:hypothetical protein
MKSRMSFARIALIASLTCGLFAASANAAPFVYVVTLFQQFGTIDLANGQFTPIGNGTPDGLSNLMYLSNGSLLSLATTGSNAGYLATINLSNGKETAIRPIKVNGQPLGTNAFSLAEVGNQLYVTDFSNNLYSVDFRTGNATPVGRNGGTTGLRPDPNVPFTTNDDGTFNLCDEALYAVGWNLYATFDSFAINTPATGPPAIAHRYIAPYVWEIDPRTGAATFIANTDWQIAAIVETEGQAYAFEGVFDSFSNGFPNGHYALYKLDLRTGKTTWVADIDPSVGLVFGAVPVRY